MGMEQSPFNNPPKSEAELLKEAEQVWENEPVAREPQVQTAETDEWAEAAKKLGGEGTESEVSPASPEVMAEIEREEELLQGNIGEFNNLSSAIETTKDVPEGEERSRWDKIQDAYQSTKMKVNGAFFTLSAGGMGTAMYAVERVMEQNPALAEQLIQGSSKATWAGIGALALGHGYNSIRRALQERGYGGPK